MDNRNALFILASPLQALSAAEAQHYFKEDPKNCSVLISGEGSRAEEQIATCLREASWRCVTRLPGNSRQGLATRLRFAEKFISELGGIHRLYLGDFRNSIGIHIARSFKPAITLLDDGSALHRFVSDRFGETRASGDVSKLKIPFPIKQVLRRLAYGYNSGPLPPVTLFTIYEHISVSSGDSLCVNLFSFLTGKYPLTVSQDEVYVLGGCLPELKLVDETYYDFLIQRIAGLAGKRRVSYFPHRRESRDRYSSYRSRFGFEIIDSDMPIELFVLNRGRIAQQIIGFYSTALDSLHLLTRRCECEIISVRIPPEAINRPLDIPFIDAVYDYFGNYKERFKVVTLKEGDFAY